MNRLQFKPKKKYKSQNKKKKSLGSKVKKKKKLIIDGIFVRTANEKIYDFIKLLNYIINFFTLYMVD